MAIIGASQRYQQLKGRPKARWKKMHLEQIATTAAIEFSLAYADKTVDPKIVAAIRAIGDHIKTHPEQVAATNEAMETYRTKVNPRS
jgi:hypothetical protein